jgi:hypothetical protein
MNAPARGCGYRRYVHIRGNGRHEAFRAATRIAPSRGDVIAVTGGEHPSRVDLLLTVVVRRRGSHMKGRKQP